MFLISSLTSVSTSLFYILSFFSYLFLLHYHTSHCFTLSFSTIIFCLPSCQSLFFMDIFNRYSFLPLRQVVAVCYISPHFFLIYVFLKSILCRCFMSISLYLLHVNLYLVSLRLITSIFFLIIVSKALSCIHFITDQIS